MYKNKVNVTNVIIVVVVIAVIIAAVSLLVNQDNNDNYSKINVGWDVGGINDEGLFDDDITHSMVSDRIEIGNGFKIDPNFNKGVKYQVFYYDDSDTFLCSHSDELMSAVLEMTESKIDEKLTVIDEETGESIITKAKYYRIVITPNDKDGEIGLFESWDYGTHITVFKLSVVNK